MQKCCICGRVLPNRFAVGGTCSAEGCEEVFCSLHWHNGNHKCGSHGWKPGGLLDGDAREEAKAEGAEEKDDVSIFESNTKRETKTMTDDPSQHGNGSDANQVMENGKRLPLDLAKKIVMKAADFAVKMGKMSAAHVAKIRNSKTPQGMLEALEGQLAANRAVREPMMARAEQLYVEIAAKKKVYQSANPARKRIFEMELKTMLSEYKGIERQLGALFDNENTINTVKGRLLELTAMGLQSVSEKQIDRLTDNIEDAVEDAEDIKDATRDLDRAGARHESESDHDSFESALSEFELDDTGAETADVAADVPAFLAEEIAPQQATRTKVEETPDA